MALTSDDLRQAGLATASEMFGAERAQGLKVAIEAGGFGAQRIDLASRMVLGEVWNRPGLDRRTRSLLTLGMLIAQGQPAELKLHTLGAVSNGCTVAEIEEVLLHACIYAGFPAASQAADVVREALRGAGLLD